MSRWFLALLLIGCGGGGGNKGDEVEVCGNEVDDDGDGLTDCADDDCFAETCIEICGDGKDNDLDSLLDCDDPGCDGQCGEICDDGRDNDGDGNDDCLDSDCFSVCDADGDGFYNADFGGDDCDDSNPDVYVGATEVCDGVDNDCNGLVDRDDPGIDRPSMPEWCTDNDGDGFGNPQQCVLECDPPAGRVDNSDDCADNNPYRNPLAQEICNGVDDNCDGLTDDDDPTVDLTGAPTFYEDADGDRDGNPLVALQACERPTGYAGTDLDCDDNNEYLNAQDLDVDGVTSCDGDCDDFDPGLETLDLDLDGYSSCDGDCDDGDPATSPAVDADLDGADVCVDCDDNDASLNLDDVDGDGFATCDLDCDDNDASRELLDADEDGLTTCDGDCNDADALQLGPSMWVLDLDGDGFGSGAPVGPLDCAPPGPGYVPDTYPLDCDDTDTTFSPGAYDACGDGIDNDCDGADCPLWIEDFESPPLDLTRWSTSGNAVWFVQSNTVYAGTYGAECGNIADNQTSTLTTTADWPTGGTVDFWHTGSTEANWDYLRVYLDGALLQQWSGTWGWTFATFPVPAGVHTIDFTYYKDGSVSTGSDTVWIDDVTLPGATP